MPGSGPIWDVFCRVVDNFGDAAICWRLSRQLVVEHGIHVRLWIDQPQVLHALEPDTTTQTELRLPGTIEIHHWNGQSDTPLVACAAPPDVVVEAFGCGLDEGYQHAISRAGGCIWIVLEYLSAEGWVASRHGLPSPHPKLPLTRYFFFPGFIAGTGGLLREADLIARRQAVQAADGHHDFWGKFGGMPGDDVFKVSLFGYENHLILPLLEFWSLSGTSTMAVVPDSKLNKVVSGWISTHALRPAMRDGVTVYNHGSLELRCVPFLSQSLYDVLLWECDWNFVRGEDSFVRAQWAARPFTWQIYPQEECAHLVKLEAFLDIYCVGMPLSTAMLLRRFWQGWNGLQSGGIDHAWGALQGHTEVLKKHALEWSLAQAALPDLAAQLVHFWRDKVQ